MKLNQIECKSCGAHIKVKEDDENVVCPYCGNTYSVSEERKNLKKKQNNIVIPVIVVVIFVMLITTYISINFVHRSFNVSNNDLMVENEQRQQIENKIDEQKLQAEVSQFNMGYHSGTWFGGTIWSMLDNAITSNKTNKKRAIVVKLNDTQTSDPEEITQLKKKLEQFTKYEVKLDYDSDGFINCITIEAFE